MVSSIRWHICNRDLSDSCMVSKSEVFPPCPWLAHHLFVIVVSCSSYAAQFSVWRIGFSSISYQFVIVILFSPLKLILTHVEQESLIVGYNPCRLESWRSISWFLWLVWKIATDLVRNYYRTLLYCIENARTTVSIKRSWYTYHYPQIKRSKALEKDWFYQKIPYSAKRNFRKTIGLPI